MIFSPAPKPMKRSDIDAYVDRVQKARARQDRWRQQAIQRNKSKPRTQVKRRNETRIARKAKAYRKVLASDFHKQLRYLAFQRSGDVCECDECRDGVRNRGKIPEGIPVWFTKGGGAPWKRLRSKDGELHHTSYHFFGDENPAELQHVRWVWKECHQRIESEHGTRRRFLRGK